MVSKSDARNAIRTLLKWIGEDPNREGLVDTPERMIKSFEEHFSGYTQDPTKILQKTFTETSNYQDIVMLTGIKLYSHCEHHIAPIKGVVHIAYYPNNKVVGISKLARVVEIYSKRLQIQERLTAEIASSINKTLHPKGVAVMIEAEHSCISNRGIKQDNTKMKTYALTGCFKDSSEISKRFFQLIK